MLHIEETIVVEGKFDKEKLKKITDAPIVCTGGFSLYKNKQLIKFLKTSARDKGIIILTDSDSAGFRIRNYLKQCLGKEGRIVNAYIPSVEGKEKRKQTAGKEGLLGVEGIDAKIIEDILKKASNTTTSFPAGDLIDKAEFYSDGFSGKEDSFEMRKLLSRELNLPIRISANAMLDIINKTIGCEKYKAAVQKIVNSKNFK